MSFLVQLGTYWEGILALCAIILTLVQINNTQKHNRLSCRPNLGSSTYEDDNGDTLKITLVLSNDGLGPAQIDRFSVFFKDTLVAENNIDQIIEKVTQLISEYFPKYDRHIHAYTKGAVIPSGMRHPLLTIALLKKDCPDMNKSDLKSFLNNFRLEITYRSFYKEKFEFNSDKYKQS